ncbi:LacI family transcriptional regulator [Actinoplanes campanulatus]|uniref:LacI family transcriptional regulator n=1 Tax=Actinoplanes campanulatus TaxID=113559 RepID=A0A7W5AAX6_9ACTN|nr:LacI family DNA-binding transcriptional regulator [Actinoplanes campanulatus]MBB3092474.1 LacI family transcriptional regulator [Actinoplanes campanulatus]GGM96745.1 LacI family transcriptional regulator [Actinoplanes campanulatus]GID34431.1 LacI family transcriptional regulator [Actinoplanes campanulatus]
MPKPGPGLRLIDVAHRAGVSLATASRALAGREGVSEEVANRVRQVADELGYVANPFARTLAGGASTTVGLIVHQVDDPYFAEIAGGVIGLADEQRLLVQICHSGRDPGHELRQIRHLIAQRAGIIIIAGSGYDDPRAEAEAEAVLSGYQRGGGRVAVIGRHALGADAVLPDNEAGGHAVTAHLLGLGHRRIAVAAGAPGLNTVIDRMAGVASALREHGLSLDDLPVVHTDFVREGGRTATERILAEHPSTTAIIALNDAMAMGVLAMLRERGIGVPTRMSVVGFDDVSVAADLAPSLTTVRLPMIDMGRMALELALEPAGAGPRRRPTGHQLIVRDSTGPAPDQSR